MTDHVTQADAADLTELDVFLAAYADRHDYERIARVIDPNDDLLSLGLLRRVLARLSAELAARSGGSLIPQFCTEPAPYGDCWRACVATITGLSAASMPNFMHLGQDDFTTRLNGAREWLAPHGMTIFDTWVQGGMTLDQVLKDCSSYNPGVPMILSGQAASVDDSHSVVLLDGVIVHDPSGAGIAGPSPCQCGKGGCRDRAWSLQIIYRFGLPLARSGGAATGPWLRVGSFVPDPAQQYIVQGGFRTSIKWGSEIDADNLFAAVLSDPRNQQHGGSVA